MIYRSFILASLMFAGVTNATAHPTDHPKRLALSVKHATARCVDHPIPPDSSTRCEVSAVAHAGNRLIFANDKPLPGTGVTPLFSLAKKKHKIAPHTPTPLINPAFNQVRKLEAMTRTLDGRYLIASSAFNRVGTDADPSNDAYSTILYWPVDRPDSVQVLSPSSRGGITSSRELHAQIAKALGAPFFQIEGMSVAPDNKLLLGVRKQGEDYKHSEDVFKILVAPFTMASGQMRLTGDFQLLFEFTPKVPGSDEVLGLASIEYDRFDKRTLYALTSTEDDTSIGGYLWSIPVRPLLERQALTPSLVVDRTGAPVRFGNKPEGLEVMSSSTLLVVHDDDRYKVKTSRTSKASKPEEFAYSSIRLWLHPDGPRD